MNITSGAAPDNGGTLELPPLGSLGPMAEAGEATAFVRAFAHSLDAMQRAEIVFDYDHVCPVRGLLRAFVADHWQVTRPAVADATFYSHEQQALIHAIFRAMLSANGYASVLAQLRDDCLGRPWGQDQSVALLGDPDRGPFQFLFTGKHVTLRYDDGPDSPVAFGGPVFLGHAPVTHYERPGHPGNAYWWQALEASRWWASLPGEQSDEAVVDALAVEPPLGFRHDRPGLRLSKVAGDRLAALDGLLERFLEHWRDADRRRVRRCLDAQGGLAACSVQFARDGRMSAPSWDNWRIEGPAFVLHWRGFPHAHVWLHAATTADVPVNSRSGIFLLEGQNPLKQDAFGPAQGGAGKSGAAVPVAGAAG